ncbi:hypothetical protein LJV54_000456 [Salmonella enterica]|nr:hypothetical protein [Salmonella enterica subsp. diarizonae]EGY9634053.1 hypothetical protein [Salmonella enterica subsp. enterica serovar Rough O:c:z]EIB9281086.1 hypothetical protein [Salmonella enterica]EIK1318880.1 hypothetical protein [Salmonella enterica]EIS4583951.1 hypothetical protein [Salmonella enterica]
MKEVKIYTIVSDQLSPPITGESFCTDMVRHSDYAEIEAKYAALAADNDKAMESLKQADAVVKLAHEKFSALAAENAAMKQIIDSVTDLSNEPQYHAEDMVCGLEDRGITDRYEAMRHGWDEAMERIYGEVIPCAEKIAFPETDVFLAEVRASARNEGINYAAGRLAAAFNHGFLDKPVSEVLDVTRMILSAKEDLANDPLPADDGLSGEYAEKSIEEWKTQLRKGGAA